MSPLPILMPYPFGPVEGAALLSLQDAWRRDLSLWTWFCDYNGPICEPVFFPFTHPRSEKDDTGPLEFLGLHKGPPWLRVETYLDPSLPQLLPIAADSFNNVVAYGGGRIYFTEYSSRRCLKIAGALTEFFDGLQYVYTEHDFTSVRFLAVDDVDSYAEWYSARGITSDIAQHEVESATLLGADRIAEWLLRGTRTVVTRRVREMARYCPKQSTKQLISRLSRRNS